MVVSHLGSPDIVISTLDFSVFLSVQYISHNNFASTHVTYIVFWHTVVGCRGGKKILLQGYVVTSQRLSVFVFVCQLDYSEANNRTMLKICGLRWNGHRKNGYYLLPLIFHINETLVICNNVNHNARIVFTFCLVWSHAQSKTTVFQSFWDTLRSCFTVYMFIPVFHFLIFH